MGKFRIGCLCGHKPYGYGMNLSLGARDAIEERGHTYVMVADQVPYHTNHDNYDYMNVAFEMVRRMDLDAYVLPAGVLYQLTTAQVGEKGLDLVRLFDPAKTIVLEREFEGYHCITKDNASGMHECMRHLIEDHGYRKIAFISGPETSKGAQERETIYYDEMEAHGLFVRPEMFARGTFDGQCEDVVERIFNNNKSLDAIACACDEIAMAVYRVAQRRGLIVGRDIAVTGFDDLPEAVHLDPPLSTVHMTGYDIGYMAGRAAVRLCEGRPLGEMVQQSRFVNRGSCGEFTISQTERFKELLREKPLPMERIVGELVGATYSSIEGPIRLRFEANMTEFCRFAQDAYRRHLASPDEQIFLVTQNSLSKLILDRQTKPYITIAGLQTALNALLHALREVVPEKDKLWAAEQGSHLHLRFSRIFQGESGQELMARNDIEMHTLQIADDAMAESDDKGRAYQRIFEEMRSIGISFARIYIFKNSSIFVGMDKLTLDARVHYRGSLVGGEISVNDNDDEYLLSDILRGDDDTLPDTVTVSGLLANSEIFGVVVMSQDGLAVNEQIAVLMMLGYSIKHLQMMAHEQEMINLLNENNVMLTHQSQQDELTGLLNRRGFLLMTDILIRNNVGKSAAVFYLDLDGLKTINDTHGHDIGDEAIKYTSEILSSCFRSADLLGRQGGDEFVAFSIMKKEADAQIIIDRIEQRMQSFNEEHDLVYVLAISIGVKTFTIGEDSANRLDRLMGEADEMLYEVKRKKKGSRRFEADMER